MATERPKYRMVPGATLSEKRELLATEAGFTQLTNRPFFSIDITLGKQVTYNLDRLVASGQRVNALEIGGGYKSSASRELVDRYGENLHMTNLDLIHQVLDNPAGLTTVLGSVEDIPLPDNSQDFAFSAFVFIWLKKMAQLRGIREIRRVLKPGGRAIIHHGKDLKTDGRDMDLFVKMAVEENIFVASSFIPRFVRGTELLIVEKPLE